MRHFFLNIIFEALGGVKGGGGSTGMGMYNTETNYHRPLMLGIIFLAIFCTELIKSSFRALKLLFQGKCILFLGYESFCSSDNRAGFSSNTVTEIMDFYRRLFLIKFFKQIKKNNLVTHLNKIEFLIC